MIYRNRVILLERFDGKDWSAVSQMHAKVNRGASTEAVEAGAVQSQVQLTFDVRYSPLVAAVQYQTQAYRIRYGGQLFNVLSYDDYMESHRSVRLTGVSYLG